MKPRGRTGRRWSVLAWCHAAELGLHSGEEEGLLEGLKQAWPSNNLQFEQLLVERVEGRCEKGETDCLGGYASELPDRVVQHYG